MSTFSPQSSLIHGDVQETEQTFQPSDFSFLSQLLHIIQKIESGEEPQEIAKLSSNLKTSFKNCQMILDHLPGADLSPDEQERILAEELQVLKRKKAQLAKYLSWQVFQHNSTEILNKQDPHNDVHIHDSDPASMSEIEIKDEYLESSPSLVTDVSFNLDSSQSSLATASLPTGLSFSLADVKMEEDTQE